MAQVNNLLFVFLLLLCSTLCLSVCAGSTERNGVFNADVFKSGTEIKEVPTLTENNKINITPQKIKPPALFAATKDGVVVVIAEAQYKNGASVGVGNGEKVDVVSRTFVAKNQGRWPTEVFAEIDKTNWKTQLATENEGTTNKFSTIIASTVNADRSKVYVFTFNINESGEKKWDFNLVEGTVNGEETGKKTIKWGEKSWTLSKTYKDNEKIKEIFNENEPKLSLTDGSVFVTGEKEEQVVFVFKGKFTGAGGGVVKSVIIFFQLKKQDTGGNELELLKVDSVDGSYSFFQWKDNIFRTPINNPSGDQSNEVMVLNASNNFESSADPITRLRDFLKDKQNFATAKIRGDDDKVLLFTQQKPESGSKNDVYLWMSDGSRVVNLGIIITNVKKFFYGSLLRTETELFALYQTYDTETATGALTGDDNKIYLTILNTQLETITTTLDAWKNNSEKIKKIYNDLAAAMNPRFTDGLVGFLSNTNVSDTWKNKYSNMDATVHGGSKKQVTDGFAFSGKGAGAVWPVSKEGQNEQPYNLKDFGFTLVATVKIESDDTNGKNSILGIVLDESGNVQKSIGLWCDGGKWAVRDGNNQAAAPKRKTCVKDGIYQVALMLNDKDKTFSVHIGAELFYNKKDEAIKTNLLLKYFYFGADTSADESSAPESHVTVTNVLLYNRPLPTNEINNLKEYIKPVEEIQAVDQNVDTNTGGGSDEQTPPPLSQSTTDEKDAKKEPSPSRTEDGGVGCGVRVFSLLLAVLCVSAPLLHL